MKRDNSSETFFILLMTAVAAIFTAPMAIRWATDKYEDVSRKFPVTQIDTAYVVRRTPNAAVAAYKNGNTVTLSDPTMAVGDTLVLTRHRGGWQDIKNLTLENQAKAKTR